MGLLGITTISLADSPSSWLLGNIGPLGNRKRQGERSFGIIITVDLQSNCRGDNKVKAMGEPGDGKGNEVAGLLLCLIRETHCCMNMSSVW